MIYKGYNFRITKKVVDLPDELFANQEFPYNIRFGKIAPQGTPGAVRIEIKGTVKAHEEYRDVAQTLLSRVAVL